MAGGTQANLERKRADDLKAATAAREAADADVEKLGKVTNSPTAAANYRAAQGRQAAAAAAEAKLIRG